MRPDQALRDGRFDAGVVLTVRALRKLFPAFVCLGIIGMLTTRVTEVEIDWSDPSGVVGELLSPLAGLVLAVLARVVAGVLGTLAALPLAHRLAVDREALGGDHSRLTKTFDTWHTAAALKALRRTTAVRDEAIERFATRRSLLRRVDPAINVLTIVLIVAVVVTLFATSSTSTT